MTLWQLNPFFFSRKLQGKGSDILKRSSYCLILQELQEHEDGLDLLGDGSWHHPIPGRAWGGDGCNAHDGIETPPLARSRERGMFASHSTVWSCVSVSLGKTLIFSIQNTEAQTRLGGRKPW